MQRGVEATQLSSSRALKTRRNDGDRARAADGTEDNRVFMRWVITFSFLNADVGGYVGDPGLSRSSPTPTRRRLRSSDVRIAGISSSNSIVAYRRPGLVSNLAAPLKPDFSLANRPNSARTTVEARSISSLIVSSGSSHSRAWGASLPWPANTTYFGSLLPSDFLCVLMRHHRPMPTPIPNAHPRVPIRRSTPRASESESSLATIGIGISPAKFEAVQRFEPPEVVVIKGHGHGHGRGDLPSPAQPTGSPGFLRRNILLFSVLTLPAPACQGPTSVLVISTSLLESRHEHKHKPHLLPGFFLYSLLEPTRYCYIHRLARGSNYFGISVFTATRRPNPHSSTDLHASDFRVPGIRKLEEGKRDL
ncbi:hypothetical protein C8R47DRAFT_1070344 [Mycena vitilis]|nr:hypothetical protein C8R47DRAFT_1070344 [Mycena vitilis]